MGGSMRTGRSALFKNHSEEGWVIFQVGAKTKKSPGEKFLDPGKFK